MNLYALWYRFDANEWIVTLAAAGLVGLLFLLPKRFPVSVTIAFLLAGTASARLADVLFFPYDLYDVMDQPKHNLHDLILYTFVYSVYVYLFCYFYDKWRLRGWRQAIHLAVWVGISVLLEGIGVLTQIFTYKEWSLLNSATVYLVAYFLYAGLVNLVVRSERKLQ